MNREGIELFKAISASEIDIKSNKRIRVKTLLTDQFSSMDG